MQPDSATAPVVVTAPGDRLGHPRGLATLFFTEMWERFSYYGMRALLVLFMVDQVERGGLGFSDQTATAIYGLYTAAVYIVALPGGWLADRVWGAQKAVWVGGIIIMCGHFVLAIPGLPTFFLGLLLVVLGTGLLKPNISAVVGELYSEGDPRRDAGFTIFYMGINVGGALGPLVCGWLGQANWHYGFAAAGVGMLAGLIQFRLMRGTLGQAGLAPGSAASPEQQRTAFTAITLTVALCLALLAAGVSGWIGFNAATLARWAAWTTLIATVGYFAYVFIGGRLDPQERRRMLVILVLLAGCAMFWAGFEQAGSSLNLFAERYTQRSFGAFTIPAAWFQSLNPIFIVILAPLYSMMWVALARRHLEPSAPLKFAFGLLLLGAGFAIMIGAASLVAAGNEVLPTWLLFTYLLHTMGELALSPVGLSSITKLSPKRYVGQMMGLWFMASGLGNIIAGLFAGRFDPEAVDQMPGLYGQIVLTAVGTALVLAVLAKPLKRLAGRGAQE